MRRRWPALWLGLSACAAPEAPPATPQGPTLSHTPPAGPLAEGAPLAVVVDAADPDGVGELVLWHRVAGQGWWDTVPLAEVEDGRWSGEAGPVQAPGVEYWFRAADLGQPPAVADLPAGGEDAPYAVAVQRAVRAVPFEEGFEDAAEPAALGWWTPSTGTPGYAWELTTAEAAEGAQAAVHLRGAASAGVLGDWLISPLLDLSGLDGAMVRWQERGAGTAAARHQLYATTGSRDPADGELVLVAELAAPLEGAWGRAPAVDLSAWAGQPEVALAWYTEGEAADDWWIDAVHVGPLAPALAAPTLTWSPSPAEPGQRVVLEVILTNTMDAAGPAATATLALPAGGGTLDAAEQPLGPLPALGSLTAAWSLDLDPELPSPGVVPLTLVVTTGEDTWSWPLELVLGQPALATLGWTQEQAGTALIELGVGDPDDPVLAVPVEAAWYGAGSHLVEVDLAAYGAALPPAAGPTSRWYARLEAGSDGSVDAFTITAGGAEQAASTLPALVAGLPAVAWIPEPASPAVQAVTTEPAPLSPGVTAAALSLQLVNEGAASAGPVTASLRSADPDATVSGGEAQPLGDGAWAAGEVRALEGLLLDVSASHLDSTPVQLELLLDDGVDTWTLPVPVEVPWPVPRVVGLDVDDDGGDERIDGGEAATLTVSVGNGGTLATHGSLRLSVALDPESAVDATVRLPPGDTGDTGAAPGLLGELEPGARASVDLLLEVGAGAPGERLALVFTAQDDVTSWTLPVELALGEVPWITLAPAADAAGDAVGGYALDLLDARFRAVDGSVQLAVDSASAFALDDLFFEAWGRASDTPYLYYRWIVQPGATHLQGYVSGAGFVDLGPLTATATDERTLLLSWALADMELVEDAFTIGLAAGWCGPDTYFCDHHPDGWGYPYVSFNSSMFFPVEL